MADVEEGYEEEIQEEHEEAPQTPTTPKPRPPPPPADDGVGEDGMTETERAIWARKKKFAEQEDQEIQEYLEQRAVEMQQMAEDIEELKQRQVERRMERQEEMERMLEMQRANEEQRKADEEERKARLEADKRKKEADRKRKLQMMAGGGIAGLHTTDGKPNYVVQKKEAADASGSEAPTARGPGQTKEEAVAAKEAFMTRFTNVPEFDSMDLSELRMRIKGMHEQIARAEATKYDMEQRTKTQEYDLKELRERAKQQARQKAIKKGLDPEEYANAKHPPKKATASKFDRQTDRRSYGDRREMFDKCLRIDGRPVIAPAKAIFHGSCKPPEDFGRPAARNEELEQLRKNLEPPKYAEAAPVEGAKPPMKATPAGPVPEDDEVGNIPPQPRGELRGQEADAAEPAPEPEPAPADEEEEEE